MQAEEDEEIDSKDSGDVLKETFILVVEVSLIAFAYKIMSWLLW